MNNINEQVSRMREMMGLKESSMPIELNQTESTEATKCPECHVGYMHENVCSECGYMSEETNEADFHGISTIHKMSDKEKKDYINSVIGDKTKQVKSSEIDFFVKKLKDTHPNGVTPEEAVERAREFEYINSDRRGVENRVDFIMLMTKLAQAGLLVKNGKKITPEQMQGFIDKTHTVANQAKHTLGVNESSVNEYNKKMMGNMEKEYGKKKGKEVYYTTVNKRDLDPETGKKLEEKSKKKKKKKNQNSDIEDIAKSVIKNSKNAKIIKKAEILLKNKK